MGLFGSLFGQQNPAGYMMNLGQPQQPQDAWQMAMQPTQEQAAQAYQANPSFNHQQQFGQPGGVPVVEGLQAKGPGFFGKGGMGSKLGVGILGGIADGVARWGGAQPGYANGIQQQREEERFRQKLEAERQMRLATMQSRAEQPTNAGRMALEAGLQQGTPQYQEFVRRYAFKPTILQIPNAQGGTDYTEYDQSGMGGMGDSVPTVSDETSYNAIPQGAQYRDPSGNLRIKQ